MTDLERTRHKVEFTAKYGAQRHHESAALEHLDEVSKDVANFTSNNPQVRDRKMISKYPEKLQLEAIKRFPNANHLHDMIMRDELTSPKVIETIVDHTPDEAWQAARHENTNTDTLRKCHAIAVENNDEHTLANIAEHRNTPDDILDELSKHPSSFVRSMLVHNRRNFPKHILERLSKDDTYHISQPAKAYLRSQYGVNESFDSPRELNPVPEDSMLHSMGAMSAMMVGGENFKMHQIAKNGGYLIQFDKDHATEVHHVDDNLQGGVVKKGSPAFGFVSTFKKHIKGLLDAGKTVRIAAHENVADPLQSITTKLISRDKNYSMSKVRDTEHELTGDKMKTWEIRKNMV